MSEGTQISVDTLPMAEYKAAREEGKGSGDSVSVEELKQKEAEEPTGKEKTMDEYRSKREQGKHRGGIQARFDRLTKERETVKQENQTLKERLAQFEAKNGNSEQSSDEDRSQDVQEESPVAERAADDPRTVSARHKFRDYDKVMRTASNIRISDEGSRELHDSPLAAEVSYFIAKNPDLASELAKLPATQQVQQIRRIETDLIDREPGGSALAERIMATSSADEIEALKKAGNNNPFLLRAIHHNLQELADLSNGPAVYAALAQDADLSRHIAGLSKSKAAVALGRISQSLERDNNKLQTRAPAPIKPISGGATRSTIALDKTSYQDYKRLRQQQGRR